MSDTTDTQAPPPLDAAAAQDAALTAAAAAHGDPMTPPPPDMPQEAAPLPAPTIPDPAEDLGDVILLIGEYQSHRVVRAVPIAWIDTGANRIAVLIEGHGVSILAIPPGLTSRATPTQGDMLVVYEGGYVSWCPAAEFHAGYSTKAESFRERMADLRAWISKMEGEALAAAGEPLALAKEKLTEAEGWVLRHLGIS